ncbi:hypothetical protein D3C76_1029000 [compost metagenome]
MGRIINGMKMYTATKIKLKSVNRICLAPKPLHSRKVLMGPEEPKMPRKAYAFRSRLIQVGRIMRSKSSCLCFDLVIRYAVGYAAKRQQSVIRKA